VRRGAARPRRSDQAAAGETLSRAGRRPHRRACMGCRAPQAPSTRTRLGVPARGRSAWWPRRSRCRPRLRQPVHVLGQRPVSGVRCDRPVSARDVHAFGVQRPGVDVRRPVSVSGRSASAVSAPVTRGARRVRRATVRPGGPGPGRPVVSRQRLNHLPEPQWPSTPACPATRSSGWKRRLPSVVIMGGPGPSRVVAESLPGWTATCARGRSAAAPCSERRPLDADGALTCEVGGGGEGI
jgi:hypothetical protein